MDIGSGNGYPSSALSNFAPHRFTIDNVECYSMEGFLQSLKFKDPNIQKEVCKLVGVKAKYKGKKKKWYQTQTLYWLGEPIARKSNAYQYLLDRAYNAMYEQSESFRNALKTTQNATLTHSIGRTNENETVLTRTEFCRRLTMLRDTGKIISKYAQNAVTLIIALVFTIAVVSCTTRKKCEETKHYTVYEVYAPVYVAKGVYTKEFIRYDTVFNTVSNTKIPHKTYGRQN